MACTTHLIRYEKRYNGLKIFWNHTSTYFHAPFYRNIFKNMYWWKLKELFWEKAKANAKPYIFNFIIFHPIVFDDEKLNCTWLHTQNPRRRFFYVLRHSILLVLHFRVNRTFVNLEKTGVKILKVYVRKSNLILHMYSL